MLVSHIHVLDIHGSISFLHILWVICCIFTSVAYLTIVMHGIVLIDTCGAHIVTTMLL